MSEKSIDFVFSDNGQRSLLDQIITDYLAEKFGINIKELLLENRWRTKTIMTESNWGIPSRISHPSTISAQIILENLKNLPLDSCDLIDSTIPEPKAEHYNDSYAGGMNPGTYQSFYNWGLFENRRGERNWTEFKYVNSQQRNNFQSELTDDEILKTALVIVRLKEDFQVIENARYHPCCHGHSKRQFARAIKPPVIQIWIKDLFGQIAIKAFRGIMLQMVNDVGLTELFALTGLLQIEPERITRNIESKRRTQRPFISKGEKK